MWSILPPRRGLWVSTNRSAPRIRRNSLRSAPDTTSGHTSLASLTPSSVVNHSISSLIQLLERLRANRTLSSAVEDAIKQGVVLPILARLGWDPEEVNEVYPEYNVRKGRVDYCLRLANRSAVFLEVKSGSQGLDRHQDQLLGYAFSEGVELAALTNGLVWWLYLPLLPNKSWEQRKFYTVDIIQQRAEDAAGHLYQYLSKEQIASRKSIEQAKKIHQGQERDRLAATSLQPAWDQLVNDPDERLIDLLSNKIEGLCGHAPSPDLVAEFLKGLGSVQPERDSTLSLSATAPLEGLFTRERRTKAKTHPVAFTFLDTRYAASTWKALLVRVCEVLVHNVGRNEFERRVLGANKRYFGRDRIGMRDPEPIPGTSLFVDTHLSSNGVRQRCRLVLGFFGHAPESLTFEE